MSAPNDENWIPLRLPEDCAGEAKGALLELARRLGLAADMESSTEGEVVRFEAAVSQGASRDRELLLAAGYVLSDLSLQKWGIRVCDDCVEVRPPMGVGTDPLAEKQRIRSQELVARNEQLGSPSVQEFICSMERKRLHKGRFYSIFSLMRDGRDLASCLKELPIALEVSDEAISKVMSPYLQFVECDERCRYTGLRLQDVWRYFRHTWANKYTSVPGRTMMFLVRDAAAPNHPVMGIGALSSPIIQIRERDLWIGWHPDRFLEELAKGPSDRHAKWLAQVVVEAINGLFKEDLIEDGLLAMADLQVPGDEVLARLQREGVLQRQLHHRFVKGKISETNRQDANEDMDEHAPIGLEGGPLEGWEWRARSHLFRSKRCLALADYLHVRRVLKTHFGDEPTAGGLVRLLSSADGKQAIRRILRKAKGDKVGIAMADITVCGAIPPYGPILVGKLVSMLAVSPEVVAEYRRRYLKTESEIASSMAGAPIIRPPELVFIGTTSLYGVGSSQYNRIRIPCEVLGGSPKDELRFQELGRSESFGTSHFSTRTVQALVQLVRGEKEGQRVNSIFGEGVSPRMRKIREGLDLLGFPTDALLRHGRHRIVYGISLVLNLRDYLIGLDPKPDYLFPRRGQTHSSAAIVRWWSARWLRGRLKNPAVLEDIERHTLVHPIRHGARVQLVQPELPLFPGHRE